MSLRVSFLIDGLNLYHSIREAIRDHHITGGKWLDIRSLCQSYIYLFGKDAAVHEIYYFSALATHFNDVGIIQRHETYMAALRSTGVQPILGTFKKKRIKCRAVCQQDGWGYEEKETDVNIAVKLIELLMLKNCDVPVIVSGDTDLSAAIKSAKRLFSKSKVGVAFPYRRANAELQQITDFNFRIRPDSYTKFVFPDRVSLDDGTIITKPPGW